MKRARAAMGAAQPSAAKRAKSSIMNGRGVTNGYADPMRNYAGPFKETLATPPAIAIVTTRKPTVKKGKVSWDNGGTRPERDAKTGRLTFADAPGFHPNLTPAEVLQLGSFGGTYFRDIYSSVVERALSGKEQFLALPYKDWQLENNATIPSVPLVTTFVNSIIGRPFEHDKLLYSTTYDTKVNRFGVKCGGSLDMWESSGWINAEDPYGWFQWYCWFYLGRRTTDDPRQIKRWQSAAGEKSGRFLRQLQNMCWKANKKLNDPSISPVIRQTLQHWGLDVR